MLVHTVPTTVNDIDLKILIDPGSDATINCVERRLAVKAKNFRYSICGLSQQKYFLIDTDAEGSGLEQDKINSTYPTEGPAKLKLYNRAQSARITQNGEGDQFARIFQGQGQGRGSGGFHGGGGGWCRCHFKGRPCSSTRGKKYCSETKELQSE